MRIAVTLLFLLAPRFLHATIWEVDPPDPVQGYVEAAADGDTLLLLPGTHVANVLIQSKALTVGSLYLLDGDSAHVGITAVVADTTRPDTGSCFMYVGCPGVNRLGGLRLEAGTGTNWAVSGETHVAGGAVYIYRASLVMDQCRIAGCSAEFGAGVAVLWPDSARTTKLQMSACTVRQCHSWGWGGGLYAARCSLTVAGVAFDSCTSTLGAGGADLAEMLSFAFDSCRFTNCWGDAAGGLAVIEGPGRISTCVFRENGATGVGECHLSAFNCDLRVQRSVFSDNATPVHAMSIVSNWDRPDFFIGNVVEYNQAFPLTATMVVFGTPGDIAYNLFRYNVNSSGGVIQPINGCQFRIHHNWFEGNISYMRDWGSVLFAGPHCYPALDSNVFVGNTGTALSYEVGSDPYARVNAEYNWWGHESGPYHPVLNPGGQGDTLLQDSLFFIPWLTEPPDTTAPAVTGPSEPQPLPATWRVISCYPNPFNSVLRLAVAGFADSGFRVSLYNILGREVAVIHRGPFTGGEISYAPPPGMATGVYFLAIRSSTQTEVLKVLYMK